MVETILNYHGINGAYKNTYMYLIYKYSPACARDDIKVFYLNV